MQPFRGKAGLTVNIDVSSSSQSTLVDRGGCDSVRVMNNGTATVWIAFGDSTVTTATTTGTPIGPGVTEILGARTTDGPLSVAAIAAGATGKIYFTPGAGI
jgi:hypothetical protein